MKAVAVVPARKGSKRVPGKNAKTLGGKPLIVHTTEAALESGVFGEVIVSSDDPSVEAIYASHDGVIFDRRPDSLATDQVQCHKVLHYLIEKYGLGERFEYICLAQATCPFRTSEHFRESYELARRERPDSVIGVRRFSFPPLFALRIENGRLVKTWEGIVRTDEMAPMYHPNGALTWLRIEKFHGEMMQSYYTDFSLPFVMDWRASVDIDEAEDFELAEVIMNHDRHASKRALKRKEQG